MPDALERAQALAGGEPAGDDLGAQYMERRQQVLGQEGLARAQRLAGSGQTAAPTPVAEEEEPVLPEAQAPSGGGIGGAAIDVAKGLIELPVQAVGGVRDAVQEVIDAGSALAGFTDEEGNASFQLTEIPEAESATGGVARKVAQFATGFIPAMRLTKGLVALGTAGKVSRPLLAGAAADTAVFDEHEERLSNLVEEVPALRNPVTEYLAASPGDSAAEGRFKNAIEGMVVGGVGDAFVQSVKALRGVRQTKVSLPPMREMAFEAWINGLLSSPTTHAVNTLSNSIVALWQVPERLLATGIRKMSGGEGVEVGEATAQLYGLVQGVKEGLALAAKVAKTGVPLDPLGKVEVGIPKAITGANVGLEQGGIAATAVDYIGELVRLPGRALETEDAFFKSVGYRMELNARAWRQAVGEGHQGKALAARMQQLVANPPRDLHLASIDMARYQTFTKELGAGGRAISRGINTIPGARVIMPFIRTPANIVKFVGERTPLAPLSSRIRADISAGGARRDLALARISSGSLIMAAAAELSAQGRITGSGPVEAEMRAALRRTGWQPYSMKVGDTYYAFNRLDPLGMTLGIAADIAEIMGQVEEADGETLAAAGVFAVSQNLISKTYLSGLADVMSVFSPGLSPEQSASNAQHLIQNMGGSVVPAAVGLAARMVDPTMREVDGVVQEIRSRVPGYSSRLPPRRNLWGDPIVLQGGLGPDIMSPIYSSSEVDSPVDAEIVRNEVAIQMPRNVIDGVDLTPDEYDAFVRLGGNDFKDPNTGLGARDTLNAIVTGSHDLSDAYAQATDGPEGGKAMIIKETVNAFRAMAKLQVQEQFPQLRAAIAYQRGEAARALTGEAVE